MKNKTIFDAVNEFKGEWSNVDHNQIKSEYIFIHSGEGSTWKKGELIGDVINHSPTVFDKLCTKEEFNALVEEMKLGLDINAITNDMLNSYTYSAKELLKPVERCFGIDSDKLAEVFKKAEALDKKVSNAYTQEMADNGVFPSVGMECLINFPDIDDVWHEYTIDFMGNYTFIASCEDVSERFGYVDDVHFKPLAPPAPLIDGECYQFNSPSGGLFKGYYIPIKGLFVAHKGSFDAHLCTNIQPLTLAGE